MLTLVLDHQKNLWRVVCQCCRANFHSKAAKGGEATVGQAEGSGFGRSVVILRPSSRKPQSHLLSWKLAPAHVPRRISIKWGNRGVQQVIEKGNFMATIEFHKWMQRFPI